MSESGLKKTGKVLLLGLTLAVIGFLYAGFFYTDPVAWVLKPSAALIVRGARFGIPLVVALLLFMLLKAKTQWLRPANVVLVVGSLVVVGFIAYPFLNYLQHRSLERMRAAIVFHPYLQLMPNVLPPAGELGNQEEFRVFCLGGSTTEWKDSAGLGWPKRLEQRLQAHFGTDRIKVYNLAREWYTSLHTLINYQTNLRKYRPDVVIVMHTINDLVENADFSYFSHGPFREDYGHFYGPINNILSHQRIEQALLGTLARMWYFKPRALVEQKEYPGLVSFERNLSTLIDLAGADRTQVVLMTQPSLYKDDISAAEKAALYMFNYLAVGPGKRWSYASVQTGFRLYNGKLKEIAQQRNTHLFDLDSAVAKDLDHFKDDVHYRDKAFDTVADYVSQQFIQSKLFTK